MHVKVVESAPVAATTCLTDNGTAIKVVDSIDGKSFRLTLQSITRKESIVLTDEEWGAVCAALDLHEKEKVTRQFRKEKALRELQ